jgi:hypothetical protein
VSSLFLRVKLPRINFLELKPGNIKTKRNVVYLETLKNKLTGSSETSVSLNQLNSVTSQKDGILEYTAGKTSKQPTSNFNTCLRSCVKKKLVLICRQEDLQSTVVPAAPRLICRLKIHFLRQNGMETIEDER